MRWRVAWTERALKDAERLDHRTRERVITAIERLADTGQGEIRPLKDSRTEWRLRVGDWRVRYAPNRGERLFLILRVLPRDRAYRW
jgi:mRNA-degrading endonuclease RelE of RelBE toxin-antitoxin system